MRPVGRARSQRFTPEQDDWLKRRAAQLGRDVADLVREAVDEKMAREGPLVPRVELPPSPITGDFVQDGDVFWWFSGGKWFAIGPNGTTGVTWSPGEGQ